MRRPSETAACGGGWATVAGAHAQRAPRSTPGSALARSRRMARASHRQTARLANKAPACSASWASRGWRSPACTTEKGPTRRPRTWPSRRRRCSPCRPRARGPRSPTASPVRGSRGRFRGEGGDVALGAKNFAWPPRYDFRVGVDDNQEGRGDHGGFRERSERYQRCTLGGC